jgi:Skp family chaperone for outer membrane proteins
MENEVNTTPEVTEDKNTSAQEIPKPNETETQKDINSDLFKLQVENAKYKKLVDKYSSEIAALKKEVNEKSSQQEILDREKAEAEAEKEAKAAEDHRLVQIYQAKDYYR